MEMYDYPLFIEGLYFVKQVGQAPMVGWPGNLMSNDMKVFMWHVNSGKENKGEKEYKGYLFFSFVLLAYYYLLQSNSFL